MLATLTQGPKGSHNFCFELESADGRCWFVQSDWEYPAMATACGFVVCPCGETDGTVDCAHKTASRMMAESFDYLEEHDGKSFNVDDDLLR